MSRDTDASNVDLAGHQASMLSTPACNHGQDALYRYEDLDKQNLNGRNGDDFELELDDACGDAIASGAHPHKATPNEALYHLVCVIIGTGILALPYALRQSGWIGVLIILFSAAVNDSTGRMLVACLYSPAGRPSSSKRRLNSYAQVGQAAFGRRGKILVDVFYRCALGGITTMYIVLAGTNAASGLGMISARAWICVLALVAMIPVIILRSLKEVAVVSLLATLVSIIVVVIIIAAAITQLIESPALPPYNFISISGFPSALATVSFSFGGNFIYPDVEHSLADPSAFPSVLRKAMLVVCLVYIVIATMGYAAWGMAAQSPILANLPPDSFSTMVATASITLHVLLACPVLISTLTTDIERSWTCPKWLSANGGWSSLKARIGLRMGLAVLIAGLAASIPYFTDWVEVMGAIANTALVFVFPVVFYYQLNGWGRRSWGEWCWISAILGVGITGGVLGGVNALVTLVWLLLGSRCNWYDSCLDTHSVRNFQQ
ncbi:hypothetical protein SeMB42_g05104 [Synchytrium endobioticum]|uniref:Amino acid transporter transmembrane domain-containing protein n=1 Tax=Synchytrium endobioticum TaxID=286115 RepID=A0A507CTN9_9FUNG|nr:hypothetical protein SeMB42_g05104 [Synchytrium endobioticum]